MFRCHLCPRRHVGQIIKAATSQSVEWVQFKFVPWLLTRSQHCHSPSFVFRFFVKKIELAAHCLYSGLTLMVRQVFQIASLRIHAQMTSEFVHVPLPHSRWQQLLSPQFLHPRWQKLVLPRQETFETKIGDDLWWQQPLSP